MDEAMEYNDIENNQEDPSPDVVEVSDSEPEAQLPEEARQAQEDSDDDGEVAAKRGKLEGEEESKAKQVEDDQETDNGDSCPICMDVWSNSGEHRLCSLRCGHLFGHSCVVKWLQVACTAGHRRCPQCNVKAAVRDIRVLYARRLTVMDTTELDKVKRELVDVTAEKKRLEMEISNCHLRQKIDEQRIASMKSRLLDLERQQTDMSLRLNDSASRASGRKFYLEKTVDICKNGNCRVLDYNIWQRCLAVSQKSANPLFAGYGVVKVDTESFQPTRFVVLHTQPIRDVAFHPNNRTLMMSVSFDRSVKILDVHNNIVVHGYPTDSQLWSGCWSTEREHTLLVGGQNGSITEFDTRQTSGALSVHPSPGDRSPVASLVSVPSNSSAGIARGGFVAAHLNTCYAYELKDAGTWSVKQMYLEGPFISVRYNAKNNHALISSRPNSRTPNARHTVFTIEKGNEDTLVCNFIHTFNGGESQQLLSRPCHVNLADDTLVALHQESTRSIPLFSISSGKQIHSLSVNDPVLDMCAFEANNTILLATLSGKKLRLYNYG